VLDCLKCKRWQDCIGKSYFEYADIRYCPYQVLWILENAESFLSSIWPGDESGDTDNIRVGYGHEAYFVKCMIVIGEVEYRMRTTGKDGEILLDEVGQGYTIDQLSYPAHRALMYLKGNKTKTQTYSQWKRGLNFPPPPGPSGVHLIIQDLQGML